ncbi:MAG: 3-oxoacyl-ACP synthase [Bacteroidetes bacterium GWE2_29_8]|nr:MAG: 3-oxoacyl-ACP synthase [Bacteroidetes bacterium GWE2_29_8]OFY14624.1 MAG: 3-oxoacyl-ACP synthase [Bacteroidetes bacterium GWF2_29_10]
MNNIFSIIKGTGSYIPSRNIANEDFINNKFFFSDGRQYDTPITEIIENFHDITAIKERRYVSENINNSDIAYFAAKNALETSGVDKETLDYIIVAHNFGDINSERNKIELVPCLASKVKSKLGINNPYTVAYDITFGCPGWVLGLIQGNYYIKSGDAKRVLVIGAETMSRVLDPHDRDSMIFGDGAAAVILEGIKSDEPIGIITHSMRTDSNECNNMIWMGYSYNPDYPRDKLFVKMNGKRVYQYAITHVPIALYECIRKAGLNFSDIKKLLIHQSNAKMDKAILERLCKLFFESNIPKDIMPMIISKLGNSSVATVPTLLDLIMKGELENHSINSGDHIVLASVGVGMSINAIIYKMP